MFKNAIVRKPCAEIIHGLTTVNLGKPDYEKALEQHHNYVEILKGCDLTVKILEADSRWPDSTFVEDVAVCTSTCAVITRPGALSRREEVNGMKQILREFYDNIEEIKSGTLDGGDVMMVGNHFYIGISGRTDNEGADGLIRILEKYGMRGSKISLNNFLHLKTGASYLENNNLLVTRELAGRAEFKKFNCTVIEKSEEYSANSLWINETVIIPAGFPGTKNKIEMAGYKIQEVDVSEFQKVDGGLSCLSLRF